MRELIVAACCLVASTCHAQERLPDALGFEDAVRLALELGPARVEEARAGIARAARRGAAAYENPTFAWDGWFTFDGSNEGWNGLQQQFTLGIPLAIADPMSARARVADLGADAADARSEAARRELAREAALAWLEVLTRRARAEVAADLRTRLAQLARIVEGRAGVGDRSRFDVLRIRTEVARAEAEVRRHEEQVRAAARALGALLGEPDWAPTASGSLEASLAVDLDVAWSTAVERLPAHRAAERAVEARRAAVERERREAWPVPTLGLGYAFATDLYASAAYVGLTTPIPVFDQHEQAIAIAEAERDAAEVELEVVDRVAAARLARARRDRDALAIELERFDAEVVAPAAPLVALTEIAYRDGAATVIEIVDAARTWQGIAADRVERLGALRAAEIELRAAAGLLP